MKQNVDAITKTYTQVSESDTSLFRRPLRYGSTFSTYENLMAGHGVLKSREMKVAYSCRDPGYSAQASSSIVNHSSANTS